MWDPGPDCLGLNPGLSTFHCVTWDKSHGLRQQRNWSKTGLQTISLRIMMSQYNKLSKLRCPTTEFSVATKTRTVHYGKKTGNDPFKQTNEQTKNASCGIAGNRAVTSESSVSSRANAHALPLKKNQDVNSSVYYKHNLVYKQVQKKIRKTENAKITNGSF